MPVTVAWPGPNALKHLGWPTLCPPAAGRHNPQRVGHPPISNLVPYQYLLTSGNYGGIMSCEYSAPSHPHHAEPHHKLSPRQQLTSVSKQRLYNGDYALDTEMALCHDLPVNGIPPKYALFWSIWAVFVVATVLITSVIAYLRGRKKP